MSKEPEGKKPDVNMDEPHPEHPGLTRAEVEKAKKRGLDAAAKRLRDRELDKIAEQAEIDALAMMGETERTMHELEHLSPANKEMVDITLNLAPQMRDIRLDGVIYVNRKTYTVPRAKAAEMLRIQFEGWRHEAVRKGDDSYAFYAQQQQQARSVVTRGGLLSSLVLNASGGVVAGTLPKGTH